MTFFMSKLKSFKDLVLFLVSFGDMGNVLLGRVSLPLFFIKLSKHKSVES